MHRRPVRVQASTLRYGLCGERRVDPVKPAYALPSFAMSAHTEPRSITELMGTRPHPRALPQPAPKELVTRPTPGCADINVGTFHQRFHALSATRQQPARAEDIANAKPAFLSRRSTNPLRPAYTGLDGGALLDGALKLVPPGRRFVRAADEDASLRTRDIERCFANAYYQKYRQRAKREPLRVDDILGAQRNTICREPQVWRHNGPHVDPGVRHYPEALPTKRTNRVDDIAGAQAASALVPAATRKYYAARAAEAKALNEFAGRRAGAAA